MRGMACKQTAPKMPGSSKGGWKIGSAIARTLAELCASLPKKRACHYQLSSFYNFLYASVCSALEQ